MNKEEYENVEKICLEQDKTIRELDRKNKELQEAIETLKQENKEQEEYIEYWQNEYDKKVEIIDKAIETLNIRSHNKDIVLNMINNLNTMDKALELLKGDSNEEKI